LDLKFASETATHDHANFNSATLARSRSLFPPQILDLAERVVAGCRSRGWHVATAESCTGGLVAAALTAIPGSSGVVERGFVAYSNEAKTELLGVPPATIMAHGAVSAETTAAMAEGALARAAVDLAVAVTGIAGPGGGSALKPVGLVFLGLARRGASCRTERHLLPGDRGAVRGAALRLALGLIVAAVRG
jgi:nicotinamide-nucleotide amidase